MSRVEHLPGPALAPISAATAYRDLVVVSGQAAVDLETGVVLAHTIEEQCEIALNLLLAVLREAGASPHDVLRVECYLTRREDFGALNAAFARAFPPPAPARTTIICGLALDGMLVELQALAVRGGTAPRAR
jgi:2-iminobutanoate/2-iminopropanoate deaminase